VTSPDVSEIRVVLLDIEGTTTPISFVHETLFPFAAARLESWFTGGSSREVEPIVWALRAEHRVQSTSALRSTLPPWSSGTPDAERASALWYARWLMERDSKSPALKALQGLIWEDGYQAGQLRGVVFDDVPSALVRWRDRGVATAIYSSGSELAQRRLFESTPAGDLSALVTAFFDTRVGGKRESESYARIAAALGRTPGEILFISDVVAELDAAAEAGCRTCLSERPGNPVQEGADRHWRATSFDDVLPAGKVSA
jgi:enolase-phosphatase E1